MKFKRIVSVLLVLASGLLEVTEISLREVLFLSAAEAELYCIVAVVVDRLLLDDDAGTGLYYGDRNDLARLIKDLGHTDFLSDNAFFHFVFLP